MKRTEIRFKHIVIIFTLIFLMLVGAGLWYGIHYIENKLLASSEAMAIDIALLVKNNFQITDDEVEYMKSLSFNEMETDDINKRLMDVGNGVSLHAQVTNVYLVAPLTKEEYRYCEDPETAEFLGVALDEPLDGIWLLNGKINADGVFEAVERENIYRYTVLDANQWKGILSKETVGSYSKDAWGNFITGYAPIYTIEGNFVGLLGIDMDPDTYQEGAQKMVLVLVLTVAVIVISMTTLFVVFLIKYVKAREGQREYRFYSDMSHEMRTPMNGILGVANLSKSETDVSTLQRNMEQIEKQGQVLLKLMNITLDYRKDKKTSKKGLGQDTSLNKQTVADDLLILQNKHVLLCEDHPLNAQITKKVLLKVGMQVDIAENGKIALDTFTASQTGYYDIILMDLRMPVMDGFMATRYIRSLDREDARTIGIIALTANAYDEDKMDAAEAGMNAHLTKPVIPQTLYHAMLQLIR